MLTGIHVGMKYISELYQGKKKSWKGGKGKKELCKKKFGKSTEVRSKKTCTFGLHHRKITIWTPLKKDKGNNGRSIYGRGKRADRHK